MRAILTILTLGYLLSVNAQNPVNPFASVKDPDADYDWFEYLPGR